jgi:hypothetical protein
MIELGEICEVIYGTQRVTGKIFISNDLARSGGFFCTPLSPWLAFTKGIVRRKDWGHNGV